MTDREGDESVEMKRFRKVHCVWVRAVRAEICARILYERQERRVRKEAGIVEN